MAMNKKEQAEFEAAKREAAVNRALRWTEPVSRDLMPPNSSSEVTQGWDFNAHSTSVYQVWSSSVHHGIGVFQRDRRNGSQNSRALFSTEVLALRALRFEIEMECAKKLATIDARITELLSSQ